MAATVDFPTVKQKSELNLAHFKENCHRYHDVVCDYDGDRPDIVVLCGSSRFFDLFQEAAYALTLAGCIVLSVGCDAKSDRVLALGPEAKMALDDLHRKKIDLADRLLIVTDRTRYVGDSTKADIAYAKARNKPVHYSMD